MVSSFDIVTIKENPKPQSHISQNVISVFPAVMKTTECKKSLGKGTENK